MAESREQLHTCELCGEQGYREEDLRSHMQIVHVEGSPACPFCDISSLTPSQLQVHVNKDHLDFLTPDGEDEEGGYMEGGPGFGSLWELEKCAEMGITADIGYSPSSPGNRVINPSSPSQSSSHYPVVHINQSSGNPFTEESEEESETEDDTTLLSTLEKRVHPASGSEEASLVSSPEHRTSPKRHKNEQLTRDKSCLSLPLKRPTGGCDPPPCSGGRYSPSLTTAILYCPMCPYTHADAEKLQLHVNVQHLDQLSPAIQVVSHECPLCSVRFPSPGELESHFTSLHTDLSPLKGKEAHGNTICPVCGETCWNTNQLQIHVETHFCSPGPRNMNQESSSSDVVSAEEIQRRELGLLQELERREKAHQRFKEEKEFNILRAQYGMDNEGNFCQQSEAGMMKAVTKGELSVRDFYERKADIAVSHRSGIDDRSSMTPRITDTILSLSTKSAGVKMSSVCARVDHFASNYGDKGWGCGFRNLQMLLSCLLNQTQYRERLLLAFSNIGTIVAGNKNQVPSHMNHVEKEAGVPSIPRLQEVLEAAWRDGFDRAGCEQLGGKIVNTRKWIGATEILTILSYCGIKSKIIDFHKPSGEQGSHPLLFEWVWNYFRSGSSLPPLYLQHQGHSRTICGVEGTGGKGSPRLLVLDPSHSPKSLADNPLRLVRKALSSMKSGQYQIVSVVGTLTATEREEFGTKLISSIRIP